MTYEELTRINLIKNLFCSPSPQSFEISGLAPAYSPMSIIRSPRPLIMIRFIRVFLKFSMPKARINQIFKRSSHQGRGWLGYGQIEEEANKL